MLPILWTWRAFVLFLTGGEEDDGGGGDITYVEMIRTALMKLPDRQGSLPQVFAYIEVSRVEVSHNSLDFFFGMAMVALHALWLCASTPAACAPAHPRTHPPTHARTGALPRPPELEERVEPTQDPRLEDVGAPHDVEPFQHLPRQHAGEEHLHPRRLKERINTSERRRC